MRERETAKLFDSITNISDDIIELAQTAPLQQRRHTGALMKWGAAAACLCLLLAAAVFLPHTGSAAANTPQNGAWDALPGGIRPEILLGGTHYFWSGTALEQRGAETPYALVYTVADGMTYLPEGYTPYGEILCTSEEPPTQERQMMAGFEASGTIYTSEDTPEAVYVLMTTDWFKNTYIRFVSAALDDGYRVCWNGSSYRLGIGDGTSPVLKALPEGCAYIGNLHFIGSDAIPLNDLETNCAGDTYSYALEGRAVYADPDDPEYIYVYEKQYWREGAYDAYLKCRALQ